MICSVCYFASGAGMVSFAFPMSGSIQSVYVGANQATDAYVSLTGVTVPASGLTGSDRALICNAKNAGAVIPLDFPIDAGQLVFIDAKTAATFNFTVKV